MKVWEQRSKNKVAIDGHKVKLFLTLHQLDASGPSGFIGLTSFVVKPGPILDELTVRGVHVLSWTAMFALCIELRSFPVIRGID
eukprot:791341-Rhodomonas_salina.2